MDRPTLIPGEPLVKFLARLGFAPLDLESNELHYRLVDALKDAGAASHIERLVLVRGVLSAAHEDASTAMSVASAKADTIFKARRAELVKDGKSVAAATAIAEGEAQAHRNEFTDAQSTWRSIKEYAKTVDKDFERARSNQVDARQGNHVGTYGGGLQ